MPAVPQPRARKVPIAAWPKLVGALLVGLVVVVLVPSIEGGGNAPPVGMLLISGFLVGVVALSGLYWTLTRDLKLPTTVVVYALGFNSLVVLVKFVFAPDGMYQVNREVPFTGLLNVGDPFGTAGAAILVLLLYVTVYGLIYQYFTRKLPSAPAQKLIGRILAKRTALLVVLGGTLLMAMAGGGILLLIPLVGVASGAQYLEFVFTSAGSLAISVALGIATVLAGLAIRESAERAAVVGDIALVVSFFWVGLCFLALYHVLWVVYILVLTSIWPLKVVVPK